MKISRRGLSAFLAVAVLALSMRGALADDPIIINAILSLTGPIAYSGTDMQQALRVYENVVNSTGGVRGRPIHFQIADDQSSPQVAVPLANSIIEKKVAVFLGPGSTGTCAAVEPIVRNSGPVQFCLSPGLLPQQGSMVFASSRSVNIVITAMARFANDKGYLRIGELSATDATGQNGSRVLAQSVKGYPALQIVDEEHFDPTAVTIAAEIQKIKATNPQCLFVWASGAAFGTVLRDLRAAGVEVPIFTSSGNYNKQQLAQYASFMPRDLYFDGFTFQGGKVQGSAQVRKAYTDFTAAFKNAAVAPTSSSAYAWDPAIIVVSALKRLGPDATASQIRDYIAGLHDFASVNGVYDYRRGDQHGLGIDSVILVKWDGATGEVVAVSQPGGHPQ
jgi:branched-chain amino acid transport system substrate-binding protein